MNKFFKNRVTLSLFALIVAGLVVFVIYPPGLFFAKRGGEFAGHWMLGLLGIGLLFLIFNLKRYMLVSLCGCAALAFFLKTESNANLVLPTKNSLPKITIAHVNLATVGDEFDNLVQMLNDLEVEMISFQEVTPDWGPKLNASLGEKYQFNKSLIRIDPFGMAIYSKYPFFTEENIVYNSIPNLCVSVRKGAEKMYLLSSYVLPPFNRKTGDETQAHLLTVAEKINKIDAPAISAGDFNMVYWSNEIRNFRQAASLLNSRRNTPVNSLEVPYDHIFHTDHFECIFFQELRGTDQNRIGIVGKYQFKSS